MKERPILFNAEMVRAILEGRKTQTRRVVKSELIIEQAEFECGNRPNVIQSEPSLQYWTENSCPFGQVGDRLWVRETFTQGYDMTLLVDEGDDVDAVSIIYKADGKELYRECPKSVAENWGDWSCDGEGDPVFKPSIHMPRWASRITLEITNIRVERLNDISKEDALMEGIVHRSMNCPRHEFFQLWNSIHGEMAHEQNPWVWVVEFKVVGDGL